MSSTPAQQEPTERVVVFGDPTGENPDRVLPGYSNYRIPAILADIDNLSLMAICEARTSAEDNAKRDLAISISADGGTTWGTPTLLNFKSPAPMHANHNPTLIPGVSAGCVHLLFGSNYQTLYIASSTDFGTSWSKPVSILGTNSQGLPPGCNCLAVGPGRGIRCADGNLLATIWFSTGGSEKQAPSGVATIISTNEGLDWSIDKTIWAIPKQEPAAGDPNPMESVVIQKSDGSFYLNIRCSLPTFASGSPNGPEWGALPNCRMVSTRTNSASDWSLPSKEIALPDPGCFGAISQLDNLDDMVFSNISNGSNSTRAPLAASRSIDGGGTWSPSKVYETEQTGYSDITSIGSVVCALYEYGWGADWSDIQSICFRTFEADWLLAPDDRS